MFTGIVEEVGKIAAMTKGGQSGSIAISANTVLDDIHLGDSIAVNGVCLSASSISSNSFTADVMPQTMGHSNLGSLKIGSLVNLERAMAANGRFGGHIVTGHIDGTGKIVSKKADENAVWLTISAPDALCRYIVEKGSIAIDGVSLTVAKVTEGTFQISMIPHTGQNTTLLKQKIGVAVNLECDVLAKYIEKLLQPKQDRQLKRNMTSEFLAENGFL